MKKVSFVIFMLLLFCVSVLPATAVALNSATETDSVDTTLAQPVSPALNLIANNTPMAKSGLCGKDIVFSEDDFCRALNVSSVGSLTITGLPSSSEGRLLLGTTAITEGQTISRANLGTVVFKPATEKTCKTSFVFSVGESGYSIECGVYILNEINQSPTLNFAPETALNVIAYTDTAVFGELSAYDPEGDKLTYDIIRYPSRGLLIMNDTGSGEYTYLPTGGYSGTDSFVYVVHDKYGNYSASKQVMLNVSRPSTSIVYGDMKGNHANNAAIMLTEKGIMTGSAIGLSYYFSPEISISRVDFLVCAMKTAGITNLPAAETCGFYDDAQISAEDMPFVAAAKQLGYITGEKDNNGNLCFKPDEKITRAEAALIVDRIINGSSLLGNDRSVIVFSDASTVPVWAESSVVTLNSLGILDDDNGRINAVSELTRADAAVMFVNMYTVLN